MNFATHYFMRYMALPPFFREDADEETEMIVVIPCMDDDFVFRTLDSLEAARAAEGGKVEVIVHVNSGEQTPTEVVMRNRAIFDGLAKRAGEGFYKNFRLLPMITENTVKKKAGVGFARKTAMDEAVRRFAAVNNPAGLIVSLDADTLVAENYFRTIEQVLTAADSCRAACFTFQFRHDDDATCYAPEVIRACRLYEIYLRYYRLALKTFDSPFAVHTIGSCFAVRAGAYVKLGGMTTRQGGEDFYFLQKAVKMRPVREVQSQIVFPSPRVSNRTPFGTGPSVRHIIENGGRFSVYNFELFLLLKSFFELFPEMEQGDPKGRIPKEIIGCTGEEVFDGILAECRNYSSSSKSFVKRMYDNFDAFFIVRFLNMFNGSGAFPPVDVREAGRRLLRYYGVTEEVRDLYGRMMLLDVSR
jgi:hypothetical protein